MQPNLQFAIFNNFITTGKFILFFFKNVSIEYWDQFERIFHQCHKSSVKKIINLQQKILHKYNCNNNLRENNKRERDIHLFYIYFENFHFVYLLCPQVFFFCLKKFKIIRCYIIFFALHQLKAKFSIKFHFFRLDMTCDLIVKISLFLSLSQFELSI